MEAYQDQASERRGGMSTCLFFEPVMESGKELSDKLKYAFRNRFDYEGGYEILTDVDKPYLQGLKDAGIEDANTLLAALEQYDRVKIWEDR